MNQRGALNLVKTVKATVGPAWSVVAMKDGDGWVVSMVERRNGTEKRFDSAAAFRRVAQLMVGKRTVERDLGRPAALGDDANPFVIRTS